MKKRWLTLIAMLFMLSIFIVACSNGDDGDNETDTGNNNDETENNEEASDDVEQILKVAADQDPSGLDPHTSTASSSHRIMGKIYEGLITLDDNMEFTLRLAADWDIVDETTYVFQLRDDVVFHNGDEMTADDVKYSFERILDPETGAIGSSNLSLIEEINVLGDYEVEIKLSQPFAPFLSYLASGANYAIVPKEVVEEHGDLNQNPVGTGPFVFSEMVPDTHVILTKNEDYYLDGQPYLDELHYLTMVDESSRIAAIRTGEVDLTTVTPDSVSLLEGNDELNIISYDDLEYYYLGFNATHEALSDKRVRQAISVAVDRQEFIDLVMA